MLWKDGAHAGATDAACTEAEAIAEGRFSGVCTARYSSVFHGFAAEVRTWRLRGSCCTLSSLYFGSIICPIRGLMAHRKDRLSNDTMGSGQA